MNLEREAFAIYSKNCLRCSHLVESATKTYNTCHHSKGNSYCPASEVTIVVTGKIDRYIKRLKKARARKDAKAESKVWASVEKESEIFKSRFYDTFVDNI